VQKVAGPLDGGAVHRGREHATHSLVHGGRIGRPLPDDDLAGLLVEHDQVGEGPADVDSDACRHIGPPLKDVRVLRPRARLG
jgi:hypothetical protein